MKTESLLHQTRLHFPRFDVDTVKITPIEKGGSGRRFYRVHSAAEQKLVLVKYDLSRKENREYVQIAKFLEAHQIRAPKIYHHDADEGLIWIEDLGEEDLFSHRHESWMVRRVLYESTLDEAAKLHRISDAESSGIRGKLSAEFNVSLYIWEQNYFFKNCLGRCFQMDQARLRRLATLPALSLIAQRLDQHERVLVHRDFQSQNIIVRNAQAYLIDFQGMRPGLAQYDVASLLFDPYVQLTEAARGELIEYYIERQKESGWDCRENFSEILSLCAIQRLMQALGAYGFLGLVKKHTTFLKYIPGALDSLRTLLSQHSGFEPLEQAVNEALADPRKRMPADMPAAIAREDQSPAA
jgi:aminoglycoside/choline kinase family phosphotransferase